MKLWQVRRFFPHPASFLGAAQRAPGSRKREKVFWAERKRKLFTVNVAN